MKAILCRPGAGAQLEDVPVPALQEGEALVTVEACGLCGSDLLKLDGPSATNSILGHEVVGRIEKTRGSTGAFKTGDRVVVAHHVPCGDCHSCRRGHPTMCDEFKKTNLDPGGFSEFVRVSARHLGHTVFPLPEGLDPLAATLTEPVACCLRSVKRIGVQKNDRVAIIGLGSIGLIMAQLVRHFGGAPTGFDLDEARLTTARSLGIATGAPDAAPRREFDALIFTAGGPALAAQRLSWLRDGGTLNVFAELKDKEGKFVAPLDLHEIYHRELSVISSYSAAPEDLKEALSLIASGAVRVDAFTRNIFPLERFSEAVRQTRARAVLKAILVPQ
jgi:L-iditol 2-dehydrogenase